jgi:hypothetical protein
MAAQKQPARTTAAYASLSPMHLSKNTQTRQQKTRARQNPAQISRPIRKNKNIANNTNTQHKASITRRWPPYTPRRFRRQHPARRFLTQDFAPPNPPEPHRPHDPGQTPPIPAKLSQDQPRSAKISQDQQRSTKIAPSTASRPNPPQTHPQPEAHPAPARQTRTNLNTTHRNARQNTPKRIRRSNRRRTTDLE